MTDKYFIEESKDGYVKIADEVINRIAEETAFSIEGVVDESHIRKDGMKELFNVKNLTKQTTVETDELSGRIDLFVTIEYGFNVVDVATEIQEKVKEAVETMTDLEISKVNVHIVGIRINEGETIKTAP